MVCSYVISPAAHFMYVCVCLYVYQFCAGGREDHLLTDLTSHSAWNWNANEKNKQNERVIKLSIVYRNIPCVCDTIISHVCSCVCVCASAMGAFLLESNMFSKLHQFMSIQNECVYTIWHVNSCKKWTNAFTSLFIYFPFYDIAIRRESAHIILVLVLFFFFFSPGATHWNSTWYFFAFCIWFRLFAWPQCSHCVSNLFKWQSLRRRYCRVSIQTKWQQQLRITATVTFIHIHRGNGRGKKGDQNLSNEEEKNVIKVDFMIYLLPTFVRTTDWLNR